MEGHDSSLSRIIVSLGLIIGCFGWTAYIFSNVASAFQQTAPDRFTIWLDIMIAVLLLFLGIGIGAGAKIEELTVAGLFLFAWSIGFLLIPLFEGYSESFLGSWAILGMVLVAIYYKYRNSRKKNEEAGIENRRKK